MTLPCTKAEAEALEHRDVFADADNPPVLLASEPDEDQPEQWELQAYFDHPPLADELTLLKSLSSAEVEPLVEALQEQDWVTLSQQGLAPISAGRFYVHTSHYPPAERQHNFLIPGGLAFGTGQHATTYGCLSALDTLGAEGAQYDNILDLGTGTGLLIFAARTLWPNAHLIASDIDPISITVSAENATANAVPLGESAGQVALVVADGMASPALTKRAPYDFIIANILAQPLIDMAADIAGALAEGGTLLLSGLLNTQAETVTTAYVQHGLKLTAHNQHGDWGVLRLSRST